MSSIGSGEIHAKMLTYLIYAAIGCWGLLIGFLTGFFVGTYKSPSPESAYLEKELRALEKQTEEAQIAADGLLKQAHIRREPQEQSHMPMIVIGEDAEQPSALLVRIRELKNVIRI